MLPIFTHIFDTIFPPPPCVRFLRKASSTEFIRLYQPNYFAEYLALADFHTELVKAAISANKFHHYEPAAALLAILIEEWLKREPVELMIFVPIPLGQTREKERGHNQVKSILKLVSRPRLEIRDLLARTRETLPQTSLGRAERLKNLTGAFTFTGLAVPKEATVVIVDDVITTGATLQAAKKTLRLALPKETRIIGLALAH